MNNDLVKKRIVADPSKTREPMIKGTKIFVRDILDDVAYHSLKVGEILTKYSQIDQKDLKAALKYLVMKLQEKSDLPSTALEEAKSIQDLRYVLWDFFHPVRLDRVEKFAEMVAKKASETQEIEDIFE